MGHRRWVLLFLPLSLLLSLAGGKFPWEEGCPKPKPEKVKVRGHCSPTCLGNKWVQHSCTGIQGPDLCGNFCGVGLCSRTEIFNQCGRPEGGLVYNEFFQECAPEDWTCPEEDWDCQDPCLYSCDNSNYDSICKVLNRKTGEIGRCSWGGVNLYDNPYEFTGKCWDTPKECEPCWSRMGHDPKTRQAYNLGDSIPNFHAARFSPYDDSYGSYGNPVPVHSAKNETGHTFPPETEEHISLDDAYCRENSTPEKLRIGRNSTCCLMPNFRENVRQSVGSDRRRDFEAARDVCCSRFQGQTRGVDAIRRLGCRKGT